MDELRHRELAHRKRMMQLRIKRRNASVVFREVASELCASGVKLSKSMPSANALSLGNLAAGPGEDEELLFDGMDNASIAYWTVDADVPDLVRNALNACCHPAQLVAVIWNPFEPGLRIRARDLSEHVAVVLGRDWTTWIVSADLEQWLIQIGKRSESVAFCTTIGPA